jgi:hypothetical protein
MRFDVVLQITIGVLLAIGGLGAVMFDALRLAIFLWLVLAFLIPLTIQSYGKQTGWNRISTRRWSLIMLAVCLVTTIPLYRFLKGNLVVELSPCVVTVITTHKTEGEILRHTDYGLGVIARIHNTGRITERISALEIAGEIDADGADYSATFGEGLTLEEIDREYGRRKPYYGVSFVSFPINLNKVESGEEFIRFLILDPSNIGLTQATLRGMESKAYFGFHGENPSVPLITTTVPNIYSLVSFAGYERRGAGNGWLLGPRLREEVKSGRLKFILKFDSGDQIIDPQNIQAPALISLNDWNRATPQDVFFRNNIWDKVFPVEKDAILERLK